MKLFLSAGEPSGDLHAANLAAALLKLDPTLELVGLGGPKMAAAGVRLPGAAARVCALGVAVCPAQLAANGNTLAVGELYAATGNICGTASVCPRGGAHPRACRRHPSLPRPEHDPP